MFMQIAIGAIGIGVVLMVGYLVIAQVQAALFNTGVDVNTSANYNPNVSRGMRNTMNTVFAGFGLIAVGIIVLAAFGLINIFQ
jgi:hypothetical protein